MKRLGIVLMATVGLAAMAQAADVPTKKEAAPAPAKIDCWSSFYAWLNNSATDCPLSAYGVTLYGTVDVNAFYAPAGAGFSPTATQPFYGIQKPAHSTHNWQFGFNGLSTSVVGLKLKEAILPYGWSLIGVLEAGVNPYSGMFLNGPRSLADNNVRPQTTFPWQTTNADSSRAGQWGNSQAYIGVSHPTWGTLTFGRTNTLALDLIPAYDPTGGSQAFSLIGFSTGFPGFGNTETARTTAVTYRLTYQNFRAAAQATVGGYNWDNGVTAQYQGQLGADFGNLSLDGVLNYSQNAVSLSSYAINPYNKPANLKEIDGSWFITQNNIFGKTQYYNTNDILKATLSNNFGAELAAKYKWNTVTFYAGYLFARLSAPSNSEANGFETISSGIFAPSGAVTSTAYPYINNGVLSYNTPGYPYNRVLNTIWTGFKWSARPDLDIAAGFYYQTQNNYAFNFNNTTGAVIPAACTGTGGFITNPAAPKGWTASGGKTCAGSQDGVSIMIDYRPVKRVDLYAGVMLTNFYGGLGAGATSTYYAIPGKYTTTYGTFYNKAVTQNWDPTIGVRIRF